MDEFVGGEGEEWDVFVEEKGFGEAGEGGIGFEEKETMDKG